jgi:Trk K+ transport system NAD-binding subunit
VRILAIRERDGDIVINPSLSTEVEAGGSLTAFGTMEELAAVEGCCSFNRDSLGNIMPDI